MHDGASCEIGHSGGKIAFAALGPIAMWLSLGKRLLTIVTRVISVARGVQLFSRLLVELPLEQTAL